MSDVNRVENSSIGGHNIQIGSATGDITLVLDQPSFRLERLTPAPKPKQLPRSQRTPSYLLDAQRQIVPYRPRPETQRILIDWRDDEERFSVRLLSGQGGAGKTRLGGWFATDSHVAGWTVLQATDKSTTLPDAAAHRDLPDDADLLVITDYAERWPLESLKSLVQSLAALHREATTGRVRVLLLARPQQGFWESVKAQLDRTSVDLAEPIPMPTFVARTEDLAEAFRDAAIAFQTAPPLSSARLQTAPGRTAG